MMPKFLPLLDRAVDSIPLSDVSGTGPEVGGAADIDRSDGARPRSAFAELMSSTETDSRTEPSSAPIDIAPIADGAAEPFAPGFDLPAFLQVLPRSGNEVAMAAAREPSLAAAVRRLPTTKPGSETRSVDAPEVAMRLPTFLVAPMVDAPSLQPAVGTMKAAAQAAEVTAPPRDAKIVLPPGATLATVTTSDARTATAALESALRRSLPTAPSKDSPAQAASTVSNSAATAPVIADPSSTSPPPQPIALNATRHKATHALPVGRKESGVRDDANGRGLREPMRPEPSALVSVLQRPLESTTARSDTTDRGSAGSPVRGGVDMPPPTAAGNSSALDPPSLSASSFVEHGGRSAPSEISLRQPVGTEAWQDELSAQLSFMADQGEGGEAVMKLAPEELGELEVRMEIRDGEAALQFGVANADARQAVEAAQTKLRDLFLSQGMNVSEFRVFSNLSGNANSNSSDGRAPRSAPRPAGGVQDELEVVVRSRRSVGVLDLYA